MDSSHFVLLTGIAIELPQDTTDELDSFKLLFGDDIVDYNVAETKLYAQQSKEAKARKRHCMQCKKDEKRLLVVERKRLCMHCANILAFFSITVNFINTGTFLLNYFVYGKDSVK